jgi:hypothetical protein
MLAIVQKNYSHSFFVALLPLILVESHFLMGKMAKPAEVHAIWSVDCRIASTSKVQKQLNNDIFVFWRV